MKIDDENDNQDEESGSFGGFGGGTGESGAGGKSGEIRFRYKDAASLGPRDDMLSPAELKRLLLLHKDLHKERVDKQKLTRKEREAAKKGRLDQVAAIRQRAGMGSHAISRFKSHPISNKAQFSGIDKQTSSLPNEFDAETNLEMRDKLENRLQNRLSNAPKFNPKLRPRGA